MRLRSLLSRVALLALALGLASPCTAQAISRQSPVSMWSAFKLISDADVGASREAVVNAYSAYLDAYEPIAIREDAELDKIRKQSRSAPGALLSVQDASRVLEVQEQTRKRLELILDQFVGALKEAAPAESAPRLDAIRDLLWLEFLDGVLGWRSQVADISDGIQVGTELQQSHYWKGGDALAEQRWKEDSAAARQVVFAACIANLKGRLKAFETAVAARANEFRSFATRAEALGVVGSTAEQLAAPSSPERAALRQDMQYSVLDDESRRAILREEYKAYLACEASLSPSQRESVMSRCFGRWGASPEGHVDSGRNSLRGREVVQFFLRVPGLTEEQRTKVRDLGRLLIKEADAECKQKLVAFIEGTQWGGDYASARKKFAERVKEIAKVAGVQVEETPSGLKAPSVELTTALSPEDNAEFGWAYVYEAPETRGRVLRTVSKPVPYPPDMEAELCASLSVPAAQQAIVAQVLDAARARWTKEVQPLSDTSDPKYEPRSAHSDEEAEQHRNELRAEVERTSKIRSAAFEAAFATDDELFASLRASLGSAINPALLNVAAMKRRLEHAPQRWDEPPTTVRLDMASVALNAPVSPETRAKLAVELALLAPQWEMVVRDTVAAQSRRRGWDYSVDRYFARENPDSELGKKWAADELQLQRASAAWQATAKESEARLTAIVPPSEVEVWERTLGRLKYPRLYADTTPLSDAKAQLVKVVNLDAAAQQKLDAIAAEAQVAILRAGDAAVVIVRSMDPEVKIETDNPDAPERVEIESRSRLMTGVGTTRVWLAATRMCLEVPPETAARIPAGHFAARLAGGQR